MAGAGTLGGRGEEEGRKGGGGEWPGSEQVSNGGKAGCPNLIPYKFLY